MNPTSTNTAMPMGVSAKLPLSAADMMPPISAPAAGMPPQQAAGLMAGPGGTPLGAQPAAPAEPPYDIQMQPDGSALWMSKTEPPVVIAVVPAPKLPVSMNPQK